MSLKTYTVTVNGASDGNIIAQPFTIDVHAVTHYSGDDGTGETVEFTKLQMCTKNGSDIMCNNDDLPNSKSYDLQASNLTRDAVLAATIEADLDAIYGPGNWS